MIYVVWSSQMGARAKHVAEAAGLMDDPRAHHYWDGNQYLGTAYQSQFGLESPAWDIWLLFDREANWGHPKAPEPAWWEHQLRDLPREKKLKPKRFAQKAAELLAVSGGE